jgi:hypothetical protein
MAFVRHVFLTIFILATMILIMVIRILDSSTMSIRLFGYFVLAYWCWFSCRCGLTTLTATRMHVALVLRLKLKLWENLY